MGVFYPQCSVTLRVTWEDFGIKQERFNKVYVVNALARRVRVNINDVNHADTFDMEMDYRNFPFDPRCIRAIGVTIHMEDMRKLVDEQSQRVQIENSRENTMFVGFADDETITFDDQKRTVKIEGRDYTALLIDQKYLGGLLDLSENIAVVIGELLKQLPAAKEIKIDKRLDIELPVLSSFYNDKEDGSGKKNPKRHESYWDLIQDIVRQAGLIAFIELDLLVITRPQTLYTRANSKIFIYGTNISNMEMKRKIGRKRNFNVVVRSMNETTKQVLTAKVPEEATDAWSKETGIPNGKEIKLVETGTDGQPVPEDKQKAAPYQAFRVANVADHAHLVEIAQTTYDEIGRQQLDGSFQTKDMYVAEASPEALLKNIPQKDIKVFNILKLRVGTPLVVEVDQNDIRELTRYASATVKEKQTYLVSRGYDSILAEIIATNLKRLDTVFYTKSVEFSFDSNGNGFSCKVDFLNFIEAGNQATNG